MLSGGNSFTAGTSPYPTLPNRGKTVAHHECPRLGTTHTSLTLSPLQEDPPERNTLEPGRRFPVFRSYWGLRQRPSASPQSSPPLANLAGPAGASRAGARRPGQTLPGGCRRPGRPAGGLRLGRGPAWRLRPRPLQEPPSPPRRPPARGPTLLPSGPARPRLGLPAAGSRRRPRRTCRTRCRASTKPSAFMPPGAPWPCTSSAMAAPRPAPLPAGRPSARGPVAGKGKSPHFRRKGRRDTRRERSRVCGTARDT